MKRPSEIFLCIAFPEQLKSHLRGTVTVCGGSIEQEAQLLTAVIHLVFFAGRTEPLFAQKCNRLRKVFYLLSEFCVGSQEGFIFLSGDGYGVGAQGAFSLAFTVKIIPYFHQKNKLERKQFQRFQPFWLPKAAGIFRQYSSWF